MRGPLLLLLLVAPVALAQAPPGEGYMLHMIDEMYVPRELSVPAGATVIAMNFGSSNASRPPEPHTVTSSTDRSLFDVREIQPTGEAYPFEAPSTPGTYPFFCIYHGNANGEGMAGTLVVTEAAAPSPAPSPGERGAPGAGAAWLVLALVALALVLRR